MIELIRVLAYNPRTTSGMHEDWIEPKTGALARYLEGDPEIIPLNDDIVVICKEQAMDKAQGLSLLVTTEQTETRKKQIQVYGAFLICETKQDEETGVDILDGLTLEGERWVRSNAMPVLNW